MAKFAAGGKAGGKKDLGLIAMTYGHIYVASVAMGAKDEHTLKAFIEAVNSALVTALDTSATTTSVNYITVAGDHLKPIEVSGTTTISLGDATTMGAGYQAVVYNKGTNTVTVAVITATDSLNGTVNGKMILRPNEGAKFTVAQAGAGYFSTFLTQRVTGALAAGRNITARTNATTPNTKVDITADEIVLRDANNSSLMMQPSSSRTLDLTCSAMKRSTSSGMVSSR